MLKVEPNSTVSLAAQARISLISDQISTGADAFLQAEYRSGDSAALTPPAPPPPPQPLLPLSVPPLLLPPAYVCVSGRV